MNPTPEIDPRTTRARTLPVKFIVRALRARFGSMGDFALAIGRNRDSIDAVIRGKEISSYIAGKVGEALGRPPCRIWPKLYAPDGGPLSTWSRRRTAA